MSEQSSKPVVMFVDDSVSILETAKLFLKDRYEVVCVKNGMAALAMVLDKKPDILFLDVMMPELDGYSTFMAIRSNHEFDNLPIVILSSKDSPFDKARGQLAGCSEYLTKPFSPEDLLATIRRHVQ